MKLIKGESSLLAVVAKLKFKSVNPPPDTNEEDRKRLITLQIHIHARQLKT